MKTWYQNGVPTAVSRIQKAAAPIYGWECPLLAGSNGYVKTREPLNASEQVDQLASSKPRQSLQPGMEKLDIMLTQDS